MHVFECGLAVMRYRQYLLGCSWLGSSATSDGGRQGKIG